MKLIIQTENPEDEEKFKRALHADDAFCLIWEISQMLHQKMRDKTDKDWSEVGEEISDAIYDSNLLDLWK